MRLTVFNQDNCVWCTRLHPHITKFAEDKKVHLEFVNISDKFDLVEKYKLRSTPAVMVIDNDYVMAVLTIKPDKGIAGLISEIEDFIHD